MEQVERGAGTIHKHIRVCPQTANTAMSASRANTRLSAIQNHTTMSVKNADKSKPYMPLASLTQDGYSNEDEATATCFCGAVQLAFVSLTASLSRH